MTRQPTLSSPGPDWAAGPGRPLLAEGAVHVWRADLTAVSDELLELLSPEERVRAERFSRERDRQLWTHSRGLLRALLGRYLHADPRTLRLATGTHGKPALADDPLGSATPPDTNSPRSVSLSFNLSHSGGLALYAFAPTAAVGVDVEVSRRSVNAVAIAARTFGAAEASRLELLDAPSREREFLRAWVRYEAELKCLGVGIGAVHSAAHGRTPWIAQLEMGPRAAAAVGVELPPHELRCWEWPPRADASCG
jgi:4'-phosphopantetheinyl transferase